MQADYRSRWWRVPLLISLAAFALLYSASVAHFSPERIYYHASGSGWQLQTVAGLLLTFAPLLLLRQRLCVLGCAIAGSGVAANLAASLLWRSGVPNYFEAGESIFNVADVLIALGGVVFLAGTPVLIKRILLWLPAAEK